MNRSVKVTAKATKKVMPSKKNYQIFLSHKHSSRDSKTAMLFKKCIESLYPKAASVFVAEEISPGECWHPSIFQALRESDEFVLLYADNSLSWDWPMFEAGCFAGRDLESKRPISIICHQNITPPSTFFDRQHVMIDSRQRASRTSQPFVFFRSLHDRITKNTGINKPWAQLAREAVLTSLCNELRNSVGRAVDTVKNDEIGFTVELRKTARRRLPDEFEISSVKITPQWHSRFAIERAQSEITWSRFIKETSRVLDLPMNLEDSLILWARLDAVGIDDKPRLGCVKVNKDKTLLRFVVVETTRLHNGDKRITLLLLKPTTLLVDSNSPAPNLYLAELFLARCRALQFEVMEPSVRWMDQFASKKRVDPAVAKLCLMSIECVLLTTIHEFELRGFSTDEVQRLIAQSNQEHVSKLFIQEAHFVRELRKRCSTPGFDINDIEWLNQEMKKYGHSIRELLYHAADAISSAVRSERAESREFDRTERRPWWSWRLT